MVRKRRHTGNTNMLLVIPSGLIFIFATLNVMGIWINAYRAFIVNAKNTEAYLDLIAQPAKTIIQTGQVGAIILADALMVYRTFVVWNSNKYVVVIPCLTFVATFISGVSFVRLEHHTNVDTSIFAKGVTEWTVAFLLSSFATTVYSTGLITYKLISTQIQLRRHGVSTGGGFTHRITRIIVESAALYSLNHLLYAVLYEVKSQVENTPSYLEASLASITCSLIIVRAEEVIKHSQTLPTSDASYPAVPSPKPLVIGKYSIKEDGKIFALRSMGVNVDAEVSKAEDEGV